MVVTDDMAILPVWEYPVLGNRILDYLVALGIFLLFILAFKWIQWAVLRSLESVTKRTATAWDDSLIAVVRTVRPPFYWFLAFYLALRYLAITGVFAWAVRVILISWAVYQVVVALRILLNFYVEQRLSKARGVGSQAAAQVIRGLANAVLWTLGVLFVLQNVGVNVTSLIAGLGIGGVAVALAAQRILGDLFSALAIYFDKPFEPGDFIRCGEAEGTVQRIGIRTTRLRSANGEEIIVPNTELATSLVRNFGRRDV
ncbi:MAG: mechanosensitive ion channel [Candidatus Andersenbacteria bacterium]|nr:mechanosensitive ion channel [Candidatus Andersenbacteria bacterium]